MKPKPRMLSKPKPPAPAAALPTKPWEPLWCMELERVGHLWHRLFWFTDKIQVCSRCSALAVKTGFISWAIYGSRGVGYSGSPPSHFPFRP